MRGPDVAVVKWLDSNLSSKRDLMVICGSCKRVKDNQGYWKDLDGSWKTADIVLSHGLCPKCAEKYNAEIMELVRAST